jgi:oxalate decarboxylase
MLANPPHGIYKGGREWRVDSSRFPISTTVTGVVLDLEPGALRELHWHPNADEWQYVIEGAISVTMFGSHGRVRTEILHKGDVGFIPQGYGHSIENVRCALLYSQTDDPNRYGAASDLTKGNSPGARDERRNLAQKSS